jgi:long-chain fatty acid transport protein
VGFGGNAGVLVEASPSTRFGVTYRSQVDQDFEDTATASNLGPLLRASLDARGLSGLPVDLSLTIPQEVMVSAYHDITPEVAIMANFVWQNWAEFGKPELSVSTESITVDQEYEDTYGLAVGSHLRVADPLLLQLGFAYDTSATSDSHRSPAFSVDEQYRWAVGLQYERDESLTFGIAYELFYMSNAPIDQTRTVAGTLKGDYSTNFIHFFGLTLSKKF